MKSSDGYRKYNQAVPQALHNRPSGVVKHIMSRIQAGYPCKKIREALPGLYNARSDAGNDEYQVWLGSDNYLPSCQCLDYKRNRLPCKHICAVIRLPNVGWDSLGSRFSSHPLITLDECVLQPSKTKAECPHNEQQHQAMNDDEVQADLMDILGEEMQATEGDEETGPDIIITQEHKSALLPQSKCPLKMRKRQANQSRHRCVQTLKYLHDELYILKDKEMLDQIYKSIRNTLEFARSVTPKENNLPSKDKDLSPKKRTRVFTAGKKVISKYTKLKVHIYLLLNVGKMKALITAYSIYISKNRNLS